MNKKRWIALIGAGIMGTSLLAGCGATNNGSQSGSSGAQPSEGDKGTVTIGYVNWSEGIAMTNLVYAFLKDKMGLPHSNNHDRRGTAICLSGKRWYRCFSGCMTVGYARELINQYAPQPIRIPPIIIPVAHSCHRGHPQRLHLTNQTSIAAGTFTAFSRCPSAGGHACRQK